MDGVECAILILTVVVMVSFPFSLVWYRMRQNELLERKILVKIAVVPEHVRHTEAARVAQLRNCAGHIAGTWSKPLYPTAKQNMVTANIRSLGSLHSTVLF